MRESLWAYNQFSIKISLRDRLPLLKINNLRRALSLLRKQMSKKITPVFGVRVLFFCC